ncbi:ABC transporter ATP-binding protein [Maribacter sp. 2307ULW6-5]|uniref:ABC transporter ATP-binding protein n=1 Tax=Maribacter sp. 2307ULW6-5 TaxID=3386275 RepID=UPI0039BC4448
MDKILVANGVTKRYGGHTALKDVSLEIPENSIYGLLGPNGAGKTTLLRIINQITRPDEGTVFFNGAPLAAQHIAQIGYLPEERGLYKGMKVGEQALYLARLKGMGKAEAKKKLKFWFDRFNIGDWWNKKVQELSKGMAQKVQFIVTVLHEPKLLIFDEPFSGFDPINANIIKDEILALKEKGATIIFSTHRMESVEELCEYMALLHKSEKILDGRLADIKRAYKKNVYDVVMETRQPAVLAHSVQEHFKVISSQYLEDEAQLHFSVQLPNANAGPLLQFLGAQGNVSRFVETVPSANDIFIRTVQDKK